EREAVGGHGRRHHRGGGAGLVQEGGVLVVGHEGNVTGLGGVERACGAYGDVAVPLDGALDEVREVLDGEVHRPSLSSLKHQRSPSVAPAGRGVVMITRGPRRNNATWAPPCGLRRACPSCRYCPTDTWPGGRLFFLFGGFARPLRLSWSAQ